MKIVVKMIFLVIIVPLLSGCASSPTGRAQLQLLPESQLDQMGQQAFAQMRAQQAELRDPVVQAYVECVVRHVSGQVTSEGNWEVVVFKDDEANAFALPGGRIGVNTGLLRVAGNQDQLATVIGHEIAHVTANHHNARLSASYAAETASGLVAGLATDGQPSPQLMALLGLGVQYGVLNPYTRGQESEADVLGLNYMARAGFDPRASVDLWQAMATNDTGSMPAFLTTHPGHGQRIQQLQEVMPEALRLYDQARAEGRRPRCG